MGIEVCGGGAPFVFRHAASPFIGSFGTAGPLRGTEVTLFPFPPSGPVALPAKLPPPLLGNDVRLTGSGTTPAVPKNGAYVSGVTQEVDGDEAKGPVAGIGVCRMADGARSTDDCRDTPLIFRETLAPGVKAVGATTEAGRATPGH